jgi:hypothetical protein
MTTNFFSPLSFVAVFGSGIRDPGSRIGKIQDPGSGINIPDPQHCYKSFKNVRYFNKINVYKIVLTQVPYLTDAGKFALIMNCDCDAVSTR